MTVSQLRSAAAALCPAAEEPKGNGVQNSPKSPNEDSQVEEEKEEEESGERESLGSERSYRVR